MAAVKRVCIGDSPLEYQHRDLASAVPSGAKYRTTIAFANAIKQAGNYKNGWVYAGVSTIKSSPMLGLFASKQYKVGEIVTFYGGLMVDTSDIKNRESNGYLLTISDTSNTKTMDGRPIAALFDRRDITDKLPSTPVPLLHGGVPPSHVVLALETGGLGMMINENHGNSNVRWASFAAYHGSLEPKYCALQATKTIEPGTEIFLHRYGKAKSLAYPVDFTSAPILDLPAAILCRGVFPYLDIGGGSLCGAVCTYWDKLRYESCARLILTGEMTNGDKGMERTLKYSAKFPNVTRLVLQPRLLNMLLTVERIAAALLMMDGGFPFPLLESIETVDRPLRATTVGCISINATRLKSLRIRISDLNIEHYYDLSSGILKARLDTDKLVHSWFSGYTAIPRTIDSVTVAVPQNREVINVKPCSRCTKEMAFVSTEICPAGTTKCKYKDIHICWWCIDKEFNQVHKVACRCRRDHNKIHNICTAVDATTVSFIPIQWPCLPIILAVHQCMVVPLSLDTPSSYVSFFFFALLMRVCFIAFLFCD